MTAINVQLLADKTHELAKHITQLHLEQHPELMQGYGEEGKAGSFEDAVFHLKFMVEAMTLELPELYAHYILWEASILKTRNIPEVNLHYRLDFIQEAIREKFGKKYSAQAKEYITVAKEKLKESTIDKASYITEDNPLKNEVEHYMDYLLRGKRQEARLLIDELIQKRVSIKDIYQSIFQVSQYEVGRLWQSNKITVAHEHYCTAATQQIMSGLFQHIFSTIHKGRTLLACSISGELHELGIRMVTDFFEMDGWDTFYLGANMPDHHLQESLLEHKADVLALSVTLPIHVSKAARLIKNIRDNHKLKNLVIMVGGYPFLTNPELWQKIGADAFAQNAEQAIVMANELINQRDGK